MRTSEKHNSSVSAKEFLRLYSNPRPPPLFTKAPVATNQRGARETLLSRSAAGERE